MKPEERISSYTHFLETSFSLFTEYSLITYPDVAWNELRKFSIFTMQQFNNNSFSHLVRIALAETDIAVSIRQFPR